MRLKNIAAFLVGGLACLGGAYVAADWIEDQSKDVVERALTTFGHEWAEVETDGLQIVLTGVAPDEATRFQLVSLLGQEVDAERIVDRMDIEATAAFEPPRFSVEMLRNDDGISLIGLIPEEVDRDTIIETVGDVTNAGDVTDMMETAAFEKPAFWDEALEYAVATLADLPKSKISVSAGRVVVTAISDSPKDKARIERNLQRGLPDGIDLELNISAPRPVIAPFTLRLTSDETGTKFDACSAPNVKSSARILAAAIDAGVKDDVDCRIGLGVPSPRWAEAVEVAIKGLTAMGGGALTFSDADVTLIALDTTEQAVFDRVVGDVKARLPRVFSLHADLPEKVVIDGTGDGDPTIPEFVATRSPEGLVQLRGRLTDDNVEQIVGAYARAQFGSSKVYLATRDDATLPEDWPIRVLAGLEGLATLESGSLIVQPDYVEVRGLSGSTRASSEISRILADKLGDAENFEIAIRYDELLDPTKNIPTPQECVDNINKILALNKIVFEPSSAEITEAAGSTVDQIAAQASKCSRVQMEIGGHTDSQGREIMNLDLSQQRAEAVLLGLLERRVRVRNLTARGYGETEPIADNESEAGREANRRIEFKLLSDIRTAAGKEDDLPVVKSGEDTDTAQDDTPDETAAPDAETNTEDDSE